MNLVNQFFSISNLLILNIIFILSVILIPSRKNLVIKKVSLWFSVFIFLYSTYFIIFYDLNSLQLYQFIEYYNVSELVCFSFGLDGVSLLLFILSTFLIPICLVTSWDSVQYKVKEYVLSFLFLEFCLLVVFSATDLLLFYVSFEAILIPMFLIIGIWGGRSRKIHAAIQFFLYTLIGSLLMLIGILYIFDVYGTTYIPDLYSINFSQLEEKLLWWAFFASFAVKVPMFPIHIWLPEAHVEAPTSGSVILAGILLKLGTYGLFRFSIPMFPFASVYFSPIVYTMSLIAIIYISLVTIRQVDLKKVIAYSSVAHMGFVTLGLFTLFSEGIQGSILLMISHGFVSSGLFILIGIIYDRHHNRNIRYFSGLSMTMPIYAILFLVFTLFNISFPGTGGFVAEFFILRSTISISSFICLVGSIGTILGAVYSIWLYNRISFGNINIKYINPYKDVVLREVILLLPLIFFTFFMGIYPDAFTNYIQHSIDVVLVSFYSGI